MTARAAVRAIAAHEWRRRSVALVALGVLTGVFGGVVLAGAALARRSESAPERLYAESGLGDAMVRIFDPRVRDAIVTLSMVADAETSVVAVGRFEDDGPVRYAGVVAPVAAGGRVTPVVVRGRAASPDDPTEVVLTEEASTVAGIDAGAVLQLAMLTPAEMEQFDTGFGDPDGPTVRLTVTGIVRVPPGTFVGTPILAGPAFADAHPDIFSGVDVDVVLRRGARDLAAFTDAVDGVVASLAPPDSADDFAAASVSDPRAGTRALEHSSRVLVGGIVAAVVAAALAVLVALAQAWARHQASTAATQQIERALGMTARERTAARVRPALASAAVAALVELPVVIAGGLLGPPGALGRAEPHPGLRLDLVVTVAGTGALALAVVVTAAAAARRAGRPAASSIAPRRPRLLAAVPKRHGWPLAGAVFARATGAGGGRAAARTTAPAVVLGVAGIVAALTFTATLDRLAAEPARHGWTSDLAVIDTDDETVAALVADERVDAVADVTSGTVRVAGATIEAYAFVARRGSITWTMLEGRVPGAPDEVVVGTKAADALGLRVGDRVSVGDGSVHATVVGIGIGTPVDGEAFSWHVLFTDAGLARAGSVGNFREAFVRLAPGVDASAFADELGVDHELAVRSMPPEVRDVVDLGSLPLLLGGFLAVLGVVAHAHGLHVTVRARRADLAVLRTMGATGRQLRLTVLTASSAGALVGVLVGAPLGWAVARYVWWLVAHALGVAAGVVTPWALVPAVLAPFVVAVVVAIVPARRASTIDPPRALREE